MAQKHLQDIAIVRLVQGRLAWYPPGAGSGCRWLDESAVADEVRDAVAQRRLRLCFAAPGEDVRLLEKTVAADEKKHIQQTLPFSLEDQVTEDIEDLHFASVPLDGQTLGVAVCSRAKMAVWHDQLAALPGIARWVPEPLLLPWREGEWCLIIDHGRAIVRTGVARGFSTEIDMLPLLLSAALNDGEPPTTVVVYGVAQPEDTALVPASLHPCVQWRRGDFYTALLLGGSSTRALNLLQGDYAVRLPLRRWWQQWRRVAVLAAVAFTLQMTATYADYRSLGQQNLALRTQVQDSYRRAVPRGAVVDAEKQLSRQLDALRGSARHGGFSSLIGRIGNAIARHPGATVASLSYNDKSGEMRMNILAGDFEAVEQLRQAFIDAGLDAVMENSNAQGEKVRARLRVVERS